MSNKPNIVLFKSWLTSYSKEDLVELITSDFTNKRLPANTKIISGYRKRTKLGKTNKSNKSNKSNKGVKVEVTIGKVNDNSQELGSAITVGDIPCLKRPYTMEEASDIYAAANEVEGTVYLPTEELFELLDGELQEILIGLIIDGNGTRLGKDVDIEVAGCDEAGLYFNVICRIDPCTDAVSND